MKKDSYEISFKRLEEIISNLEDHELTLDDSLKLFQEGIELYRFCNSKLNEAEEKIMMIVEENHKMKEISYEDLED
ncbi:MAG: exodeoxyribonuclease VII small subunit [Clostridiaceae bacterium]|nr:exodeoxyribonuclease VII small subunit [Clostridiaceae bacterium]